MFGGALRQQAAGPGGPTGKVLGGLMTASLIPMTLSPIPGARQALQAVGVPEFLTPKLVERGATGTYFQQSRRLADQVARARQTPRMSNVGPTNYGLGERNMPRNLDSYGMPKNAFGQSAEDIRAAHELRTKLASIQMNISPSQLALLTAGAAAGTAIADKLLGGALNKLEGARRNMRKQTSEKHTMGILSRVNPMVAEDPQTRARARTLYGIVHRNSPYIAKEPVVAASVINTMLNSPTDLPTVDQFQQMAKLQKETESSRERSPFSNQDTRLSAPRRDDLVRAVYGDLNA
jgi:hypothetical protein